jgi:hypothetical protein
VIREQWSFVIRNMKMVEDSGARRRRVEENGMYGN